jgi:hypothetical protein
LIQLMPKIHWYNWCQKSIDMPKIHWYIQLIPKVYWYNWCQNSIDMPKFYWYAKILLICQKSINTYIWCQKFIDTIDVKIPLIQLMPKVHWYNWCQNSIDTTETWKIELKWYILIPSKLLAHLR